MNEEERVELAEILFPSIKTTRDEIEEKYPYLPDRIKTNIAKKDVSISIVNWDVISNNAYKLKELIDNAFNRRKTNNYDHSAPLRRRNS